MNIVQINGRDRLVDDDGFYLELSDVDDGLLLLLVGNPEDPTAGIDLTPSAACGLAAALHTWGINHSTPTGAIHLLIHSLARTLIRVSTSIVRGHRFCRRLARIL
ncbi:hypothetical protein [Nocardia miyunensis]|uniref:hypothetical protein n=1 Tax=Nocardia miyunensis TaxID=282684 RepID=UPI00082D66A3|nr:hypothetical protein [Nocardia miyunensis]